MQSTPSLPLLSSLVGPSVVVLVRITSIRQVELFNQLLYLKPFNCMQTNDEYWIELLVFDRNPRNIFTVCKQNYQCYIAILETI